MLWPGPKNPYNDSLLVPLRALGFLEGDNLVVERRFGTPDELRSFANELVRMKVDLIHAGGSACVRAAVNATRQVPIVAVDLETDPIANKYVTSLARPGGNLTGFFLDLPEFSAKRLEILKEVLPKATRVVILWDTSLDRAPLSKMNSAARALHLNLSMSEIRSATDLNTAFKVAAKQKANVVMVMQSPTLDAYRDQILSLGASHRLPIMAVFGNFAADGAILTYGPNVEDLLGTVGGLCRESPKGSEAWGSSNSAADKIRPRSEPKGSESLGRFNPVVCAAAGRSGDLITAGNPMSINGRPNHRLERTAQQRGCACCWVPSSRRSSAAAQASRWASPSQYVCSVQVALR